MKRLSLLAVMLLSLNTVFAGDMSVLVAAENSPYKKKLVSKISAMLKARDCSCTVVDMKALTPDSANGKDAVVLLASVPGWRRRGPFTDFLKAADADMKKRLLVVTTANKPSWEAGVKGVHAITAASKTGTLESIFGKVESGLDRIFMTAE